MVDDRKLLQFDISGAMITREKGKWDIELYPFGDLKISGGAIKIKVENVSMENIEHITNAYESDSLIIEFNGLVGCEVRGEGKAEGLRCSKKIQYL